LYLYLCGVPFDPMILAPCLCISPHH